LGAQAAEFPALVQDGERLGGPVGGEVKRAADSSPLRAVPE